MKPIRCYWDPKLRAWLPHGWFHGPGSIFLRLAIAAFAVSFFTFAVTQIDLTSQVKGVLPVANGGTGVAYFTVSGPTAARTYTFPDASATLEYLAHKDAASGYAGLDSGTKLAAGELPNPGATTLGGVESKDCTGTGHILKINTDGTVTCSADASGPNFADAETPSGTVNGSNATFTLAHTPTGTSLALHKNGQLMAAGVSADYQLSTATITFNSGAIPLTGDVIRADYRY